VKHAFLTFALGLTVCSVTMTSGDDYLAPETLAFALRASPNLAAQSLQITPVLCTADSIPQMTSETLAYSESESDLLYPVAEVLAYSDSQQSDFLAAETNLEDDNQSNTSTSDLQQELHDLYTEQIMDLQRALDLLNLQLQLADLLIDSQSEQIQGLENSLESVKRLADARVDAEKARCPKCLKPWLNWTTRGLAFVVGGAAGRGSCDFGN